MTTSAAERERVEAVLSAADRLLDLPNGNRGEEGISMANARAHLRAMVGVCRSTLPAPSRVETAALAFLEAFNAAYPMVRNDSHGWHLINKRDALRSALSAAAGGESAPPPKSVARRVAWMKENHARGETKGDAQ